MAEARAPGRVLVEAAYPEIDGGRHPVKRVLGDEVIAECDLIADGHDVIAGRVLYRRAGEPTWRSSPLEPVGNDRYRGRFVVDAIGRWELGFEAWIDAYATWRAGTEKKLASGQDIVVELLIGAKLLLEASARSTQGAGFLAEAARLVRDPARSPEDRFAAATNERVLRATADAPDLRRASRYDRTLAITVDPPLARFSAWYELFPRSCGPKGKHGTLRDVIGRLDYVAGMGFDILYLPPIHPIGRSFRKGPNNTLLAGPNDPGSPWAIGAAEGGHTSIHPELGTLDDFRALVKEARARGLEIALDIAFQASPDHPWVKEHPQWFVHRPDGTIQYAENPPKKYQDVYPFDFDSEDWKNLWKALEGVFLFWIGEGVRVFRVDNPHTKSLRFWEWCIAELKTRHPDVIFLAEAFTRPKLMYALAKGGFTQSYTYFTWRTTKYELETYVKELASEPVADFYRPCFWPNTPDILPEHLQVGGRSTFFLRMVLAATLSSNWGIYGPAFELMENVPRPGAEEYIDNEKYQLRSWNLDDPRSLRDAIALVNRVRRENAALQQTRRVHFHPTDNDALLCFSKRSERFDNVVLVVANLDPNHVRAGHVELDLRELGIGERESFQVHDLLSASRYLWNGPRNYVELNPSLAPASVFVVRRKVRSEHDFEYFL